ncbi:hypothetical protein [Fundidesulfovibrio agrisoli]|uniref:hypothetical protein n=1 Tax=Fundidesulfovibrio agrisoli TaxID=2922717 RepID=UPI001FAD3131|nr:hypothetical protein [Fundidesulfovibrio agrisoli]
MKASDLRRLLSLAVVLAGLACFCAASPAEAADANLWLKGHSAPLFIKNIQLLYADSSRPSVEVVIMLGNPMSYEKHLLGDVDSIEFLEILGERRSNPVFKIHLKMRNFGFPRTVILMPLRELRGTHDGRPWKMAVDFGRDNDDKAESLKELKIVQPRETL